MEHRAEPVTEYDEDGVVNAPPLPTLVAPTAMGEAETSVSAIATQARAMVEARFVMALHRPRDMDTVRVKLLGECKRPGFAETARYRRPVGRQYNEDTEQWEDKVAEGPSIRFVEAALRLMGNIDVQSPAIYDDENKRILRVSVTDLETNTTYSRDIAIEKVVERKKLKKNQKPIGTRVNSYGEPVYLVRATESDVEVKGAALTSKAIRTLGGRMIPGDILEECMARCVTTRDAKIKEDPAGARKRMIDSFAELGVSPDELKAHAGQDLGTLSPAQIGELRDLYQAIKDGELTWGDIRRARTEADPEGESNGNGKSAIDEIKERARKHAESAKAAREAEKAAAQQAKVEPSAGEPAPEQPGTSEGASARQREPGDDDGPTSDPETLPGVNTKPAPGKRGGR